MFRSLFAAAPAPRAARKADARRRHLALDCLEDRKVQTAGLMGGHAFIGPIQPVAQVAVAAPAPSSAQAGTTMGLQWRFAPANDAAGDGTIYIQSVKRGTDASDPHNYDIAINQINGHVTFDVDYPTVYNGPAVKANAKVKVVVGDATGKANGGTDISVFDDRNGAGNISFVKTHDGGNITVQDGHSIAWTMDYNVATNQQSFALDSGTDAGTYDIKDRLSGQDQYENHGNPNQLVGFSVSDSGTDEGGPDIYSGALVAIKTRGAATFRNHSSFSVAPG